jgi:type I restriction enzyme S subunit
MDREWRPSTWGQEVSLEYGKALRGHETAQGPFRVFGANGPIGWTSQPLAQGPGVILGRKGAYRGVQFSPEPFFVIDTAYYVRPKSELDMRWLYYAIKYHELGAIDDGSPIPSTTRAAVYVREVDVPPVEEQRAIGRILGALDDKIELNRRINETLEAIAQALFKSWFVDFDPVRARAEGRDPGIPKPIADLFPARLVDSDLGEIPEGWRVKSLDEMARFVNGLALQKYPPSDRNSLPVIKIAQLRSRNTIGADRASADLDPDYIVEDGDILFSWSGSLECVLWAGGPGALNQHLFKVIPASHPRWLCYLGIHLHLDDFRHIAAGKATTMGHIQRHHLSHAKLAVPPPRLISAVSTIMEPTVESLRLREEQSRTLAAIRDALLPNLISGRLRIENIKHPGEDSS